MRGVAAGSFRAGKRPLNDSHICGRMIREYPKHEQSIQSLIVFDLGVCQWRAIVINKASIS